MSLPPYDRASDEAAGYDDGLAGRPRALYQSANYRRGYDRGLGEACRENAAEREALAREERQAAMLDAGPILAEYRRAKGE